MTPDFRGDELYGCEIVFRALVVSGCDTPELLDPVEEPFHEVTLPIDPAREDERPLPVALRRDVGPSLASAALARIALVS